MADPGIVLRIVLNHAAVAGVVDERNYLVCLSFALNFRDEVRPRVSKFFLAIVTGNHWSVFDGVDVAGVQELLNCDPIMPGAFQRMQLEIRVCREGWIVI